MDSRRDPESSRRDVDQQVQAQCPLSRAADGRDSFDAQSPVPPAKMIGPAVSTGIKEGNDLSRHGIASPNAVRFGFIAPRTREPQIGPDRAAAATGGNQVFELHRDAESRRTQAVTTAVARIPLDLAPERFRYGRLAHLAISSATSTPRLCSSAIAAARTTIDLS